MSGQSIDLARRIRAEAVRMTAAAQSSHLGGALSAADILAVLYEDVLRVNPESPESPDRDRFILSKGHCCSVLYAVLAEKGFFAARELLDYGKDGSRLMTHASHHVPGVELSTGSLGHGLSVGCGLALSAKRAGKKSRAFVLLGDGECDEGSTWEAAMFAGHHGLDGLVAVVDFNNLQSFGTVKEVLDLDPFADKWRAFRWAVHEVDGHDHVQLHKALGSVPCEPGRPTAVIARTVKGKGVSFMENRLEWHYKSPNPEQLKQALKELGEC